MGHADAGITLSVYTHLCGREEAERRFREAMNGTPGLGKSLATTDRD